MVRVPVQGLPSEREQVTQRPQLQTQRTIPVQDYSAGQQQQLGRAVQDLGVVAMRLGQDAQDEFDTAQIKKSENQFVQSMQRKLSDPRTGYLNTVGEAATGDNRTKVFDELRDDADAIERGLANDTQRRLFRQSVDARMLSANAAANEHEAREIKSFSAGQADTRLGLAQNDAIRTAGTPEFAKYLGLVRKEANDKADLLGLPQHGQDPDPQRRALELDATSKVHSNVVAKLLRTSGTNAAAAYLLENAGEMTAMAIEDAKGALQRGSVAETSLAAANEIQAAAEDLPTQRKILDEMWDKKMLTTEQRDSTWDRLRSDDAEAQQQKAIASNDSMSKAQDWLMLNRGTPRPLVAMPDELKDAAIKAGTWDKLQLFVQMGGQWVTDEEGNAAINMSDAAFREIPTEERLRERYRTHVSDQDLKQLVNNWQVANRKAGGIKMPEDMRHSQIRTALRDSGLVPDDADDDQLARGRRIEFEIDMVALQNAKGGDITPEINKAAIEEVFGNVIKLKSSVSSRAAGENVPIGWLAESEVAEGFWDTPSGIRVFNEGTATFGETSVAITEEDRQRAAKNIEAENAKRGPLEKPRPVTPEEIAKEIGEAAKERVMRVRAAKARKRQLEAIEERIRFEGPADPAANDPMRNRRFSPSPWGNR